MNSKSKLIIIIPSLLICLTAAYFIFTLSNKTPQPDSSGNNQPRPDILAAAVAEAVAVQLNSDKGLLSYNMSVLGRALGTGREPAAAYTATWSDAWYEPFFMFLVFLNPNGWSDGARNTLISNLTTWGLNPSQSYTNLQLQYQLLNNTNKVN